MPSGSAAFFSLRERTVSLIFLQESIESHPQASCKGTYTAPQFLQQSCHQSHGHRGMRGLKNNWPRLPQSPPHQSTHVKDCSRFINRPIYSPDVGEEFSKVTRIKVHLLEVGVSLLSLILPEECHKYMAFTSL